MGTSNHDNVVGEGLQVVLGTVEFPGYGNSLYRLNCMLVLLYIVSSVVVLVKVWIFMEISEHWYHRSLNDAT